MIPQMIQEFGMELPPSDQEVCWIVRIGHDLKRNYCNPTIKHPRNWKLSEMVRWSRARNRPSFEQPFAVDRGFVDRSVFRFDDRSTKRTTSGST